MYNTSFKRDISCFDIRSNFLVSISFLINIGKEMSLPGFRTSPCSGLMQNNSLQFSIASNTVLY